MPQRASEKAARQNQRRHITGRRERAPDFNVPALTGSPEAVSESRGEPVACHPGADASHQRQLGKRRMSVPDADAMLLLALEKSPD